VFGPERLFAVHMTGVLKFKYR